MNLVLLIALLAIGMFSAIGMIRAFLVKGITPKQRVSGALFVILMTTILVAGWAAIYFSPLLHQP